MRYLSASAVVIHYEEALYQVYAPLPLPPFKLGPLGPPSFLESLYLIFYIISNKFIFIFFQGSC